MIEEIFVEWIVDIVMNFENGRYLKIDDDPSHQLFPPSTVKHPTQRQTTLPHEDPKYYL
jgi:hypothetical protein